MQPVNISKCTMEGVSSLSPLCFYSKGYKISSLGNIFQLKYYFSVSRARFSWSAGQKLSTEPSTRASYVSTAAPSPQLPQHLFSPALFLCMIVSTPHSIKICNYSTL